jgi:predicted phage tail protein
MDLRKPSGLFFTILGAIVCLTGIFSPGLRAPLTEVNVNLFSGLSMLVFGGFLLWLAHRVR